MFRLFQIFQKFYLGKYSSRRLQWQPNLDMCVLRARFKSGSKELRVSHFQTLILLNFNNLDEMSFKEIRTATAIEVRSSFL